MTEVRFRVLSGWTSQCPHNCGCLFSGLLLWNTTAASSKRRGAGCKSLRALISLPPSEQLHFHHYHNLLLPQMPAAHCGQRCSLRPMRGKRWRHGRKMMVGNAGYQTAVEGTLRQRLERRGIPGPCLMALLPCWWEAVNPCKGQDGLVDGRESVSSQPCRRHTQLNSLGLVLTMYNIPTLFLSLQACGAKGLWMLHGTFIFLLLIYFSITSPSTSPALCLPDWGLRNLLKSHAPSSFLPIKGRPSAWVWMGFFMLMHDASRRGTQGFLHTNISTGTSPGA